MNQGQACPCMNGIITSPGYPRNYGNDINLTWLIQVPEGLRIEITFETFELELASGIDQSCRYILRYIHKLMNRFIFILIF